MHYALKIILKLKEQGWKQTNLRNKYVLDKWYYYSSWL